MSEVKEPELHRQAVGFRDRGAQILLAGGVIFLVGVVVYLAGAKSFGAGLGWVAVVPTVVGLALYVISGVSDRASKHKPFA